MDNDDQRDPGEPRFRPPKLPLAILASTFIGPILVMVLPSFFSSNELSLEIKGVIALTLFSVTLFVFCIALILKLYDQAYLHQVQALDVDALTKQVKDLKAHANSLEKAKALKRSKTPEGTPPQEQ